MGKIRREFRRCMAFLLALILCIGMMPLNAIADSEEEEDAAVVYKQVTGLSDITAGGDFVFVIQSGESYYALGDSIGSKITPQEVTVLNGIVTADADSSLPVWTVAQTEDGVSLASGSSWLAYSSSTNFTSSTEADSWTIAEGTADGSFTITNVGTTTRGVAYGVSQAKFGAYATSNNGSESYVFDFLVFKAEASENAGSTVEIPSAAYSEAEKTVTFSCKTSGVTYYYSYEEEGTYTALESETNTLDVSEHPGETLYYYAQKDSEKTDILSVELIITEVTGITDGTYVIWAQAYYKALSTTMTGSYYAGVSLNDDAATGSVTGYGSTEIWTVTVVSETDGVKTVTIAQDGAYMGLNSSGYLTYGATENIEWELQDAGDGLYYMYNTGKSKYLEWYDKYSDWSTYYSVSSGSEGMFALAFTEVDASDDGNGDTDDGNNYETDSSVVEDIAQWGGGGPYTEGATTVNGDQYEVNDMKDPDTTYQAVVSGSAVQAFTTGTSSGSTDISNWYMGGTGLGSGTDDYLLFTLSTAGWGDMTLSFRMRASNSGSGEWQLQYSADGENFTNFTTGNYSCSYTSYSSDGSSSSVSLSGDITDGIAKTSIKSATYITFSFDVPSGAENADILYIRLVPSTTVRASGSVSTPSNQGTVRIDSVVLSGSPIVDESITGYVQVSPDNSEDQAVGTELTLTSSTENAVIYYRFVDTDGDGSESWLVYDENNKPALAELPATLETYAVCDGLQNSVTRIITYAAGTVASVKMSPNGGGVYVESGSNTQVELSCATEGATIWYSTGELDSNGNDVYYEYACDNETGSPIVLENGFGSLTVKAYATLDGYADSAVVTRTFTERTQENYNIYFGQLHSHTNYSDGAGSITDAYEHAISVHESSDTLDFLAVTDHSNSFDSASSDSVTITDGSASEEWTEGNAYAESYSTDGEFIALFGYEMTWSNGLGHLNTFNTGGFQSRTQSAYTTYSTALQNYYTTLKTVTDSISQFNHPGTTFGDFSDFSYYDEEIDDLITLIEVGNGEGTVGSSSYFPSYEYYTRALDKGWHVAPTNNQDNHKGLWGDANTARTVALADELTEESIYDAMRNYRIYATEDNDLSIYYQLDGNIMGSILTESDVDDTVTLTVQISDPTDTSIGTVEVIVNGGYSLASQIVNGNEDTVTFEVSSSYSYYYIKVTEADGDIAVTAPVWVGDVEAVGITSFDTDATLAVQGESLSLNLELYNNEKSDFEVESIVFTYLEEDEDGNSTYPVIHEADITTINSVVKSMGTASYSFDYTYDGLGQVNYYVTVTGKLDGETKVYSEVLQLSYVSSDMVTNVVVDGSHYNDYVTGYYGGNMSEFQTIAGDLSIQLTVVEDVNDYYGEDSVLSDCALLVISAPAKYSGTSNTGSYTASLFEDEFIEAVADYVKAGGSVIVCGLADYSDKYAASTDHHTAAQMNKLLAAIGSTMSLNDDEVYDATNNGGQYYRLYPENFNMESEWLTGVVTADDVAEDEDYQVYSQYSGCSVNVGDGTWLVKGFDTTYSVDSDKDGIGATDEVETDDSYGYNIVTKAGDVCFLACEDSGYGGTIFAAGGVFCSDFEVDADVDDYDLPYANTTIITNILESIQVELDITPIEEVREVANTKSTGDVFRVRGYVTAGTANSDTSFFDCIYIQDETGGIDIYPFAEAGLQIGAYVEITGYLASYQGDLELKVMSYEVLDNENLTIQDPIKLSCSEAMDYEENGGLLIQVEGTVQEGSICYNSDGTLAQFVVVDEEGGEAKVFIDGYILSGTTGENHLSDYVKEGEWVSAVGVLYMHPEVLVDDSDPSFNTEVPVLRVRDCDEIITVTGATYETGSTTGATLVFHIPADSMVADSLTANGMEIPAGYYAVSTEGDAVSITIPAEFLSMVGAGNYTFSLDYVVNGSRYTVSNVLVVAASSTSSEETESESESESNSETESESESESESEVESESESGSELESETETEAVDDGNEDGVEVESESSDESEDDTEAGDGADVEANGEDDTEDGVEADTEENDTADAEEADTEDDAEEESSADGTDDGSAETSGEESANENGESGSVSDSNADGSVSAGSTDGDSTQGTAGETAGNVKTSDVSWEIMLCLLLAGMIAVSASMRRKLR